MAKKLFEFEIEEQNGEQEYNYTEYVEAGTLEEATAFAKEYTRGFYEDSDGELGTEVEEDSYELLFGPSWKLVIVRPATPVTVHRLDGSIGQAELKLLG